MRQQQTLALCIPAYNAAAYLPRLLQSAHKQAIPFKEILVYNDCSKDNTEQVAIQYGAKVVNGDINRGCSFGKNKLAEVTACNWIHFHDADDELLPNFTTLAYNWINKQHCPDVVLFDYEYRDNDTNELLLVRDFDAVSLEGDAIDYAIREQINPFCGLYNRKRFLEAGGYDTDPDILYNEDCAMHIMIAIAGLTFSAESTVSIINYRIGNSMSAKNRVKCIVAELNVIKKTVNKLSDIGLLKNYNKQLAAKAWKVAGLLGSHGEWKYSREAIVIANSLGSTYPSDSNKLFKVFCRIEPFAALQFREKMIRLLKPQLRKDYLKAAN